MLKLDRRRFLKVAGAAPLGLSFKIGKPAAFASPKLVRNYLDPWLEIDLNAISWNLNQVRACVQNRPVMAVIKAFAYGHGLVRIGKFLQKQKIHSLAVGKVWEALKLREAGINVPILNFGPFSPAKAEELVHSDISQSVYTDAVDYLAKSAHKFGKKAKVHILIDTGLGRVGVPFRQASSFIKKVANMPDISLDGLFTAFTEDKEFDKVQLQRFLKICKAAKTQGIRIGLRHANSSAGILSFPQANLDMVRPGICIYGHYPSTKEFQARHIDLKPALSLKTRVAYVKKLQPGDSVSYHRKFTAKKETLVATLPIGYSDGYSPQVTDNGKAIIHGRRWPMVAPATANHIIVNITGGENIKIGDEAVLIGSQGTSEINAEEVAEWAGTSVYKILIALNPMLPKIYI